MSKPSTELSANHVPTHEQQHILSIHLAHCEKNNIKLTTLRKEVLRYVVSLTPVKAYHIINQLEKHTGHPISPPLVYRTLDFLLKQGLIHKLEKLHAYVICKHPLSSHAQCALFHCTTCQSTQEVCDNDFHNFIKKSETRNNIQIDKSSLELYGTCANCPAPSSN